MIRPIFALGSLSAVLVGAALSRGGDDVRRFREQGQFVAEGTFRGFALPGVALKQNDAALGHWSKLYAKEAPAHFETERFLLYGTTDERRFKEIGALLEKTHALAARTLELDAQNLWNGKLAVFMLRERGEFTTMIRVLQKRRAEDEEQSAHDIDGDNPHVVAGPPLARADLSSEQQAAAEVAAALLVRKAGQQTPHWVQAGFGRASVLRAGPAKDLAAEHRRVLIAVVKNKRGLKDVIGRTALDADETALLRASMMEYLAYSGRTAKFLPFLRGFQPSETVPEPKLEQALDAANLQADKLDAVWQNWVKTTFK